MKKHRGIPEQTKRRNGVELEEVMMAVANTRGVGKRTLDNIRDCVEQLFRKDGENE